MSSAIARNIFRMFSACCCSSETVEYLPSFVTPSTSCATSEPNRSSMSDSAYSVSSGTSWRSAASIATGSMSSSARICADAIGWVTNGSPEARFCVAMGLDREVDRLLQALDVGVCVVLSGPP